MRSIAAGLIVAALLFAAGTVSLAESRHARRLAERARAAGHAAVHRRRRPRRATPRWSTGCLRRSGWIRRAPRRDTSATVVVLAGAVHRAHGADQSRQRPCARPIPNCCSWRPTRPSARARRSRRTTKGVVARLDTVVQAYADVMRKAPEPERRRLQLRVRREVARPDGKGTAEEARRDAKKRSRRRRRTSASICRPGRRFTDGRADRPRANR